MEFLKKDSKDLIDFFGRLKNGKADLSKAELEPKYKPFLQSLNFSSGCDCIIKDVFEHDNKDFDVFINMSNDDYHNNKTHCSSSHDKVALKSEYLHVNYHQDREFNEGDKKKCFTLGNLVHDFVEKVAEYGVDTALSFYTVNNTKTVIKQNSIPLRLKRKLELMGLQMKRDGLEFLLKNSYTELSIFNNHDREKVRADILIPSCVYGKTILLDVKTINDIQKFQYQFKSLNYRLQIGKYSTNIEKLLKINNLIVGFLVVDMLTGLIQIIEISKETLLGCKREYEKAKEKIAKIDKDNPKFLPRIVI